MVHDCMMIYCEPAHTGHCNLRPRDRAASHSERCEACESGIEVWELQFLRIFANFQIFPANEDYFAVSICVRWFDSKKTIRNLWNRFRNRIDAETPRHRAATVIHSITGNPPFRATGNCRANTDVWLFPERLNRLSSPRVIIIGQYDSKR